MRLSSIERKKFRVRKKLKKVSTDRYRLSVSRSAKNFSAQIIDDKKSETLVSASSVDKELKNLKKNKSEISTIVAELLAKKANDKNIKKVYFILAPFQILIKIDTQKIST